DGLTAYDVDTGKPRWTYKDAPGSIPTVVLSGDTLYVPGGGMTAVKLGENGPEGKPLWKTREIQPGMPSPLVYLGKVYATNGNGFVCCGEARTGKLFYKERVKGAFSASPVGGDGKVYCLNETGVTTVLDANAETFEVLATNDLGEETLGTPAISGGCLFIRTNKTLFCIGK